MTQPELSTILMNQSKDLFWMVDLDLQLIYANKTYLTLMKKMTGVEKKINEPVLVEGFGEGYIEKWKAYYNRALQGEAFDIEDHYYDAETNEIYYGQTHFEPLFGDDNKIFAAACQSKDITKIVKHRSEGNQLMDASLDVFCTINELGNFVYVSAASAKNWGYTPQEIVGKPYMELILEEDLPKTIQAAAAILKGQDTTSFVNRYKHKNGGIAYNLWSVRWDESAKLLYCVAKDGKEKIEQEEKILESEQRFKALVQEGSDLIGILDTEGTYKYISPTSTTILGFTPEELIGKNPFDFIHRDDAEKTLASLKRVVNEQKVLLAPFRFKNSKKEWRWIETVLNNMLDNPVIKGIVANSRDITEKVEEEQRLKLFESVVTNTKDAILITEAEPFDEPGPKILYVNEAFTKMTGYTAVEVIGKTPRMLQGPNSDKEELRKLSHALRNREAYEMTTINYKKNGEEFWVNFAVTPVVDEKGFYTHLIAIERDVTEQKIKEQRKELLAQISIHFNEENNYLDSAKALCKTISAFGKFDLVEVWSAKRETKHMHLLTHYLAEPKDELFYEYSREIKSFEISKSLVGNVWSQQKQLIWDEIENLNGFARQGPAKKIGLNAVLGIPLIFNNETVGVLNIGTKKGANYLKKYTSIFKQLEDFIGSEFNRKKLENDLSHLFESIPDILAIGDFNNRILKINKAGCELLGYNEEEILNHTFDEFIHPDDKGINVKEALHLKSEKTTFKFENRYLTKAGDIVWLSWYCNSSIEEGLIYATAKNITEEKRLRELNRQVNEMAKIGSWELDLVNQSIFWSDEIHQLHETDPKTFVPNLETAINFYRADFREMVKTNIDKAISAGEIFDFEAILITTNKKERWVRAIGNAAFEDGECKRIYGSFQDIQSRKEAEVRLASLSENLPGVVYQYIIHPDGTDSIQHISGMVEQLWGYTVNEVQNNINLLWDQIELGGDIDEVKNSIAKAIQTKSKWTCRFKIVKPNGELKTHLGNGTPLFLTDGTIVFNVIVLDVTQETKIEALLNEASQMARIGSWELDLINQKGNEMYWSPMVREIMEVDDNFIPTLEEGVNFYAGENKERVDQAITSLIIDGFEFDEEILLCTGKGNNRWVRIIGNSETVNDKRIKIYGSLQDIDEVKKSAIKLAESENRFRTILEAEPECIKLLDQRGELLMMNHSGLAMIEAESEEQVLGKSMLAILLPEHRSAFAKLTKNVFKGESGKLQFEIEGFKGTRRWLETHAVPLKNQLGEIISLLGITRDITESKKADEKIILANERFEKVTEATNDAIWDWDLVNKTYYRSNAIERFYGKNTSKSFSTDEFLEDNFHSEDFDLVRNSIKDAINNPTMTRWQLEYRVFNEKGETVYVSDRGVIIRDKDGQAIRMVGAMTDISEQKQMTLQVSELNTALKQYANDLERSNEELEQFAFVASHDLQEPLRMISGFMDQLKRKYGEQLDAKANQYIGFATDGAQRMKQIILDLLEYSRSGHPIEGKEAVDLNLIFSEFKKLRRKLISEKQAVLKHNNLPTIITYKAAITQILHCLLDNALKYARSGVALIVELKVVEDETEWNFSIKDNGIGIEEQFYDKIFVIFQRLHNKEAYAGSGIGLSITKRHVEFLGGKIWLESSPGAGSVFYFSIPKN